jgi:hypothetical protein
MLPEALLERFFAIALEHQVRRIGVTSVGRRRKLLDAIATLGMAVPAAW